MAGQDVPERLSGAQKSLSDAMYFHAAGDLESAQKEYVQVLSKDYRTADILPLLAGIVAKRGDVELALYYWDKLLALDPGHLVALMEKGALLHQAGRSAEAVDSYEMARGVAPKNPMVRNNLAVVLSDTGRRDEALAEFKQVLALQPDNVGVQHQIRRISSEIVPFWHMAMMNDSRRNLAFEAAIRQAIEKRGTEAQILDIGSGSGLLSMMAARAGAKNIVTCETVPVIAQAAEQIIAANGYAEQIDVIGKPSREIVVGEDMGGRADILISEILSSDLLAEHVLKTFEDAHERLISNDAIVIPRAATAVGCLVASETLSHYTHVEDVSGFDLSPFNTLAPLRLPLHGTMTDWTRLSGDFDIAAIDLTSRKHAAEIHRISIPVSGNGIAVGIVQWMSIDLIDGVVFHNHPDEYHDGGWLQLLHTFPQPIEVFAGGHIELVLGHDKTSLIVLPAN
jgi:type II protein arginine methyltransferase